MRKIMASLTKEELLKLVTEIVENDNNLRDIVFDVVVKIIDLPDKTTTSIAKLIDYKPEVFFVEPLMQGKVNRYVRLVCKKIEIHLETPADKKIDGLLYFNEFTKY